MLFTRCYYLENFCKLRSTTAGSRAFELHIYISHAKCSKITPAKNFIVEHTNTQLSLLSDFTAAPTQFYYKKWNHLITSEERNKSTQEYKDWQRPHRNGRNVQRWKGIRGNSWRFDFCWGPAKPLGPSQRVYASLCIHASVCTLY